MSASCLPKKQFRIGRDYLLPYLLILLCVVCVYEPVLTHCYAHTDDYSSIYAYNYYHSGPFGKVWQANGRPLMGLQVWWLFRRIAQPEQLWKLRALSLAGIAACGLALFRLYRGWQWQAVESAAIALLIIFTPAFGVYAGWAATSIVPFAVLLALLGGGMALPPAEDSFIRSGSVRIALALLGAWLSECCYQPAAGFFLLPALVQATRAGFTAADLKTLRRSVVLFFGVLAVYYVAYQLYAKIFLAGNPVVERGGLCTEPIARLEFFARQPGARLFTLWGTFLAKKWQWAVGIPVFCLASAGAADYWLRCERGKRLWAAALPAICFLLVVSPLLVAKDSYAPFRTLSAAYAVVLHFAALGLGAAGARLKRPGKKRALILVWALAALCSGLAARHWVWRGLALPNELELSRYRRYLAQAAAVPPQRIFFSYPTIPPKAFTGLRQVEEYGIYSSWLGWVPKPMLTMLLCEEFGKPYERMVRESPDKPELIIFSGEAGATNRTDLVVDGTRVLQGLPR